MAGHTASNYGLPLSRKRYTKRWRDSFLTGDKTRTYRSKYSDRQRFAAGKDVTNDMVDDLYKELATKHYSRGVTFGRNKFKAPEVTLTHLYNAHNIQSTGGTYQGHGHAVNILKAVELEAQAKYGGVLGQKVAARASKGKYNSLSVIPDIIQKTTRNSYRSNRRTGWSRSRQNDYQKSLKGKLTAYEKQLENASYTQAQFDYSRKTHTAKLLERQKLGDLDMKAETRSLGAHIRSPEKLSSITPENIDMQLETLRSNEKRLSKIKSADSTLFNDVDPPKPKYRPSKYWYHRKSNASIHANWTAKRNANIGGKRASNSDILVYDDGSKKQYAMQLKDNRQRQKELLALKHTLKKHDIQGIQSTSDNTGFFGAGGNIRTSTHAETVGSISRLNTALPGIETAIVRARGRGRKHKLTTHLADYNKNPEKFRTAWEENKKNKRGPTSLDEEISFIKSQKYSDKDLKFDELNRLNTRRDTNLGLQGLLSKHATVQKQGGKPGMDMSYTKDLDIVSDFQNKRASRPKGYGKAIKAARKKVSGSHDYDPMAAGFYGKGGKINLENYDEIRKSRKKVRRGRALIRQQIRDAEKIHHRRQKAHKSALDDLGMDTTASMDPNIKKQHELELAYLRKQEKVEMAVEKDILDAKKNAELDIVNDTSHHPATVLHHAPRARPSAPRAPKGPRGARSNHYNLQIPGFGGRQPRGRRNNRRQNIFGF